MLPRRTGSHRFTDTGQGGGLRCRAVAWLALLAIGLGGCHTPTQERLQDFTEDGVYLFERGDYLRARQSFEAALHLQPNDPVLLYNVGQCYERQGAAAKAEESFKQCLLQSTNHAPCRHALAVLLIRQDRRKEANDMIEDWLAREPSLAAAYIEDGWRLRQEGDLLKAQGRLQQALDIEPQNPRALIEMGILYEHMDMPGRALVLYEHALRQDPRQPEVRERIERLRAQGVTKPLPD